MRKLWIIIVILPMLSACGTKIPSTPSVFRSEQDSTVFRDSTFSLKLDPDVVEAKIKPVVLEGLVHIDSTRIVGKYATVELSSDDKGQIHVSLQSNEAPVKISVKGAIKETYKKITEQQTLVEQVYKQTWWQETTSRIGNWVLILLGIVAAGAALKFYFTRKLPFL